MAYDENQWASSLDYHNQGTEEALELFKWLRQKSYALIRSLPQEIWANPAYHPENGDMTLEDWLDIYDRHIPEHLQFMQENYESWLNQSE